MNPAKSHMLELGRQQAQLFLANNILYCEILVTSSCPRHILLLAYENLVRQRKLTPIEDLLLVHKQTAWETAKEIAKDRMDRKGLIEVVKALLTIEYFLNL